MTFGGFLTVAAPALLSRAFWWKRKIRELFQCAAGFYYLKINLVKTRYDVPSDLLRLFYSVHSNT